MVNRLTIIIRIEDSNEAIHERQIADKKLNAAEVCRP